MITDCSLLSPNYYEIPRKPRGRPATAPVVVSLDQIDDENLSNEERHEKYQRALNNAASKRCRVKRKRKSEVIICMFISHHL